MLNTVKSLCSLSGVSGCEDEVRGYILERVLPFADRVDTDAMGNLFVFKKGSRTPEHRVMLAAHMDEVGLIITDITAGGFLKFGCVGGIDRRVLLGKRVYIGPNRVCGIIGIKAYHLRKGGEEKSVPALDSLYIDIGARSREEAEASIGLGDTAVFDDAVIEFGEGFLKAKALDDRVGCAALVRLIEGELPIDTWFAFTVQEEAGTRGAMIAANRIQPEIALILEGTTAADLPGVPAEKHICAPGGGVVIPFMDGGTIYDRELFSLMTRLADENGIVWQTKRRIAGGTDASAFQRTGVGARVCALSAALRNIHTPASIGKIEEFNNILKLAELFLKHV